MHWHTPGPALFLINRFCKRNFMNLVLPNLQCASATHRSKPQSMTAMLGGWRFSGAAAALAGAGGA